MTSGTVHYISLYLEGGYSKKAEALHGVILALKWSQIALPIGIFSGFCTRLSICLFLLRIFRTKREWRWGLYAVMVFATVVIVPTIVSLLARCSPVQKLWDPLLPGNCWAPQTVIAIGYFNGGKESKIMSFTVQSNLNIHQLLRRYATGYLPLCQ